jgi:hypothetical protein
MRTTVTERLQAYYQFDTSILDNIERTAHEQKGRTFSDLADSYGIADGPEIIPATKHRKALEVLTFRPSVDYDETYALVYQAPMAMSAKDMAMSALRLFALAPGAQLKVIGNPSAIGNRYNKLKASNLWKVWCGDLGPTVEPHLAYLQEQGITSVDQIGYSLGADKVAAASYLAKEKYGIKVLRGVFMEPAAVVERGLIRLTKDFASCKAKLDEYSAYGGPLSHEVRSRAGGIIDNTRYYAGLARLSNLAIANSQAQEGFMSHVLCALSASPDMQVTIAWGTESELAPHTVMLDIMKQLRNGKLQLASQIYGLMLEGMHHAGGCDIDLHAAVMLQGLKGVENPM